MNSQIASEVIITLLNRAPKTAPEVAGASAAMDYLVAKAKAAEEAEAKKAEPVIKE